MDRNTWRISEPQTLEIDEVREIRAGIVGGRIDVLVHDEPTVRIEISDVSGHPIDLALRDGVLELRHGAASSRGGWFGFSTLGGRTRDTAVISLAVPEGTSVSLRTVSGEALACGTGDTALSTVTGSLLADDTTGSLTVSTVSGEGIVRHHSGDLTARTVSGALTVSGYCGSIRTNSVSGEVTLDLLGSPTELSAKTVSGNLSVRLSEEVGVDLTASSVSGTLTINDRRFTGRGKNVHYEAGRTDSTFTVRVSTVSGDVALFRRAAGISSQGEPSEAQNGEA